GAAEPPSRSGTGAEETVPVPARAAALAGGPHRHAGAPTGGRWRPSRTSAALPRCHGDRAFELTRLTHERYKERTRDAPGRAPCVPRRTCRDAHRGGGPVPALPQ